MEDKHTEAFYALWAAASSVPEARQPLVLPDVCGCTARPQRLHFSGITLL